MSYKVLYRKYRPDSFSKIIGQESIVNTLKNSIKNNTFSHAYIFTGPRGTGKTSTAKVLAKAINCENPIDGEACGKCNNCENYKTSPDIIEIDAASNNGVDEIRELRNNVTLVPTSSKYKVYIIDEVHMLSAGAFNALLKTLEEPPEHVIFILATTEIYKVPITILSRCQRYDFKKISASTMIEYLKEICKEEKIKIHDDALEEIYELSDGCLRDALSILDQTSKLADTITVDTILKEYNIISNKSIDEILDLVIKNDVEKIVERLDSYISTGLNAQKLIKRIINRLDSIAVEVKLGKNKKYSFNLIKNLIEELNRVYIDARVNENTYTMIKLAFLSQISGQSYTQSNIKEENKIETKPQPVEKPKEEQSTQDSPEETATKEGKNEQQDNPESKFVVIAGNTIDIRINNTFVEANKTSLEELNNLWTSIDNKILADIDLSEYKPVVASDKYSIFVTSESSLADLFNIKSETIEKLLKKNQRQTRVVAISQERWDIEKDKYVKTRKTRKYEYIDEPQNIVGEEETKQLIDDMFADTTVEIS